MVKISPSILLVEEILTGLLLKKSMCRDKIQKQKFDKCKDEDKCEEKGKSWSAGDQSKQASCLNACMTVGVKDEQILAQARALGHTGRV